MIEQEHIDFLVNHAMFYPAVLVGIAFLIIVLKFLIGSRSAGSPRSLEDAPKSTSGTGKKGKKSRKQRTSQEKKVSDSPKVKKDTRKNEMDSLVETDKRMTEEGKNDNKKKDGKSKTKSKKKKNVQSKVDSSTHQETPEANLDGEWQTVSTKEQREQQKREKKKLEENEAVSMEMTIGKSDPLPLAQAVYKPTANISAIAKGIAPRFARAAGEQWQEKPTIAPMLPLQSKRPMPPTTVPGPSKPQPQSSKSVTVNQTWVPGNQGEQFWPGDIGTTWPNSTVATSTSNLTSDLIRMSWPHTDAPTLLSMATSVDKNSVPGWPQGGSTWQSSDNTPVLERYYSIRKSYPPPSIHPHPIRDSSPSHSSTCSDEVFPPNQTIRRNPFYTHPHTFQSEPALFDPYSSSATRIKNMFGSPSGKMTWDISTEDWVHVNGQNGRQINSTTESWPTGESPLRSQTRREKVEEWTLEPEGFPLHPPQPDPNDPWNSELVETEENGDWSAPVSSWDNTNAEWTAPLEVRPVTKYYDELSDDALLQTNSSAIGAGSDFMNQGQGLSKKSRRRRKKKQNPAGEPEQPSTPELESPKLDNFSKNVEVEITSKVESTPFETKEQSVDEVVKDDWSMPKVSKKRKSKARKAD